MYPNERASLQDEVIRGHIVKNKRSSGEVRELGRTRKSNRGESRGEAEGRYDKPI